MTPLKHMYYILFTARTSYLRPATGKAQRSPMSRISLTSNRRTRAVCHRSAPGTRLLPNPFPPTIPHLNSHYKRCAKAERLRLRSDQSSSPPPAWKVPGQITARPFQGPLPSARPTHPAQRYRPFRRRPGARRHGAPLGHSALFGLPQPRPCRPVRTVGRAPTQNQRTIFGFHRRHHRISPVYERRSRVPAPIP